MVIDAGDQSMLDDDETALPVPIFNIGQALPIFVYFLCFIIILDEHYPSTDYLYM